MNILAKVTAVAIGLGLCVTPVNARDHSRHGDFWWESSGYAGSSYDEYSYPGIRWYDDVDCGYGYGRHRHSYYRRGHDYDNGGYGHHRRGKHSRRHHRGEWRYDRERNDWR